MRHVAKVIGRPGIAPHAAVNIGYLLAGMRIRPIQRLTKASQQLAIGDLQQQVPVSSQDEMGQLTATFNKMSADLFDADKNRGGNAGKMRPGLAICKALVEAQGGTIEVTSGGSEAGTMFSIKLPPTIKKNGLLR